MTLQMREVTLHQVRTGAHLNDLRDPHSIARMSQAKIDALLDLPLADLNAVVQILAVQDSTVVGREDLLPGELVINKGPVATSWGSAMYVPDSMRGKGIGKALAQHREVVHDMCVSCGVSNMLQPIYRKLGWIDFAMRRYILLRTTRPVVESLLGHGAMSRLGSAVGDLALSLHRGALACWIAARTRGMEVQRLSAMPAELDEQIQQQAAHEAASVPHRSVAWINWALKHPLCEADPRNDQWLVLIRRGDAVLGYILLKTRFHTAASHRGFRNVLLGSLQDWMIFQPKVMNLRHIALIAVREMSQRAVDAIEICLPPDTTGGFLRRLGFMPVGAQHFLFKGQRGSILADERFHQPEQWRLRPGDGDVFIS